MNDIMITDKDGVTTAKIEPGQDRKWIIQSWILTTARFDYNVYEKRIMTKIIENTQEILKGKKLNEKYSVNKMLFDRYEVQIPINELLLDNDDKNHARIKKALKSMAKRMIEIQDENKWVAMQLITRPEINRYASVVKFKLEAEIFDAILDFSKGYRKYELNTLFQFESVYAMRFYELLAGQRAPLIFSIEALKKMFGVETKYKLTTGFLTYVVDAAQKELDEKSPYSFEYAPLKTGRKITSVKLYPKIMRLNSDETHTQSITEQLQKRGDPMWYLDGIVLKYLKEQYEFSTPEIKNNAPLFEKAQKEIPDLLMFLSEVKPKANRATNPKGYLIGALRTKLGIEKAEKTKIISRKGLTAEQKKQLETLGI